MEKANETEGILAKRSCHFWVVFYSQMNYLKEGLCFCLDGRKAKKILGIV